jgi:hypothetical protein
LRRLGEVRAVEITRSARLGRAFTDDAASQMNIVTLADAIAFPGKRDADHSPAPWALDTHGVTPPSGSGDSCGRLRRIARTRSVVEGRSLNALPFGQVFSCGFKALFNRHSPDRRPIYPHFVGRIALATNSERDQEAGFLPEPTPMAARACPIPPRLPLKRQFRRTTPVAFQHDRLRLPSQHRATCLGRRSSISARMRQNRSRGTATSAIWNTV